MDLSSIVEILKLITGGGIIALVLAYVHKNTRISQDRERLLRETKLSKLKADEDASNKSIDDMELDKLIKSAEAITRKLNSSDH